MMPRSVLLLALAATGALSVPIDVRRFDEDTSCAKTCTGNGKFRYEPGTTYEFSYETRTRTGIEGAAEDQSTIIMSATVNVEVMSSCEFVLKMDSVRLMEMDPETPNRQTYTPSSREFKRKLEENPLRFGFQDGRVGSVCPDDGDAVWIVNLKRGVLSAFQNAMVSLDRDQRVTETDVAGECDAEYKVVRPASRWSTVTTVKKTKNLMGCRNRHGYNTAIQAIPYHVQSEVQSLPLMKSRHDCEQQIDGGRLISATCQESHLFRPFSKGSNGAVTNTSQTLTFTQEKNNVRSRPGFIGRRSDMHFEHSPIDGANSRSLKDQAESRLETLCRQTREDIRPETPQLFADLVQLMRNLDAQSLRDLYRKVRSRDFCSENQERTKKFFMDAIPMIGTTASVSIIEDLISKGFVEGFEMDLWVTSLAFIQHPSREMLAEIKPLLRKKPTGRVMLSISALVNNYCRTKSCEGDSEVDSIVSILEGNLGDNCDIRGNDAEKIIMSLRAIGNTGNALRAIPTLNRCFMKEDLPMEIRLSAVNAFRHMSCKADLNSIMNLFRNKDEDSELRINAYLSVIECPTSWVLEQVKATLESEEVNQVGSFVWTHLTNLMETSDPHKQAIRQILEDETLAKEFNLDNRKFSRNYEGSLFFEKINTGAKAESNIIFSSKSFLPRSAMLNLTVDLFGHAVNLIEIGGRVEGLEYYLESLFGPEGILKENPRKDSWRRSKREVIRKDKINSIKKQYGITSDELAGSIYMRMFGNEMAYMSMGGPGKAKKQSPNLMDILLKLARDNSYQVTQSVMFMDSSIVVPTSVGWPLKLTVNGTASLDLKVSGRMDVRKATSRPSNMHIEGVIQPSGSVEVTSSMQIDAYALRSGLKMVTTLHSSTAANGKIEVKDGKVLNVELDTPREKMEIINLNTKFFVLHRESEREQKMIDVNRKSKEVCSGERLAKLTGLEICGSIGFSNASSVEDAPYFPLTGPISLGVELHKRDSHSGYVFTAKYSNEPSLKSARIGFDTPGSRENRKLEASVELDTDDGRLVLEVDSPWKQALVKGSVSLKDDVKKMSARLLVDKRKEYLARVELKSDRSGERTKYIPVVEVTAGGKTPYLTLSGVVEKKGSEDLVVDLSLKDVVSKPINIKSNVKNSDDEKSVSGKIISGKDVYNADLILQKEKRPLKYNASIHMSHPRGELIKAEASFEKTQSTIKGKLLLDKVVKKPIKLEGSLVNSDGKRMDKKLVKIDVDTALINFDVSGDFKVKKSGKPIVSTKLTVNYQLPKKGRERMTISSKGRNLSTSSLTKYDLSVNANFNKNKMYNFNAKGNFEMGTSNVDTNLGIQYGDNPKDQDKKITFSQTFNNKLNRNKRDLDANIKLEYPAKDISFSAKGSHLMSNDNLDSDVVIRYGKDQISANAKFNDAMRKKNKASAEVGLSYPGRKLRLTSELVKVSGGQYNNTVDLNWGKGGKAKIESTYTRPSKLAHAVSSVIHIAKSDPIYLEGAVDLNPGHYKVSSGITLAKDIYKVSASSKKKGSSYDGELEAQYPGRRIMADVNADWKNKYSSSMDIKWDADNDKSQRVKVVTTFSDARGWSARKVGGSLRLTSPFKHLQYIDVNAEHSIDSLQYETTADVAWSRADKIAGTLTVKRPISLKRLETTLSLSTPFQDFRSISGEINHRVENDLSTSMKAAAGRHNVDMTLTASDRGSNFRRDLSGNLVIKSSVSNLELVSVSASHSDDGRKYNSDITADIGRHGRFSADLDLTKDSYSYHNNLNGKLVITTPIKKFEKIVTALKHRLRDNSFESSLSCASGREKLAIRVEGSHTHSYHQRLITGAVTVETPLQALREVVLNMKHEHTATKLESSASLVRNKYKKTEYSIFYDMDGDYNIESRASFVCPGIHAVSAKLNTRMIDTPMTAGVEVEWSPTEKVTLNGELTNYGLRYIDTTVRLTTPIRDLERIVLTGRHGKDDGVWTSRAALEYAPRREIEVRTKYSSDDKLLGEIIITAPFRSFQKFKVSGDYSGDYRRAINGNFQLEQRPQLGRFDVIGSYKNGRQKTANLRINTPLRDIPYSEVRGTYQPGSVQLEVEYLPNKVVNINSEYRMGNTNDLSGELTITTPIASFDYLKTSILHRGSRYRSRSVATLEYPRREEYSATLNYENDDKIDVSLDLKAPEYDDVRLSVSHSGTGRNFDSHVMLTFQKYKKIEGDLIFSLKRGSKGPMMSVESIAKSPYYEDFNLKLTHEGNIVDFKTNLVSSYGRRNRLTYNVGAVTSPDSIHTNTDLELTSDIIKPQSAAAVFNLKGELRDFKGNFEGNYQGRTIDSSISSKLSRGIEAEFTLNTPFQAAKDISLSIKQSGDMRQFNSIAKAQYNRKAFESDVSFSKIAGSVDGRVTVKTPIKQLEDLSSSFHFGGDLKNMQGSSRIQYARGKEIEVSGNVDLSGERRQIAVTIHTPFQDYETLSASGNLTGRLTNFLFNSRVQYANRKSLAVESKVDLEDRRKVVEGSITTPFYGYERLAASVNIDGDIYHFTSNSNVDYGRGKRIESDIKVNTLDRLKRASIRVTTPFENFRENSASVELQGDRSQFSTKADITYLNSQRISISSSANLNSNPKSASAVVRTPFDGFEEISVVSNFNGYSKHFKSDSRITYAPQKSIELDASVDLEGGKKTISGMIKTPFEGYKQMSIAGDYEKRPSKHQADVIVEYAPGKKIEVDGRLTLQDKRKGLRLSAKTPFDGFESISGKINFNGVPERFDGDGEVQYGRNQKIVVNCNVDVKSARKSVSVSAKTPFDGLEDVSASLTRSGEFKACQMEGSVSYGNGKTLTLNTGLDILSNQKTANVQITTPYPGFETQGVSLTVDGSPLNFQTSATLESSKLDKPILARAALNYQSPTRMDSTFSFTSAIPKAENLRLVLKNADDRQYTSHVEAQWSLRKSITLDGSFEKVNRWRSSRMIADISISTPFENARKLAAHLENSLSKVKRSIVLNIDHENRNILAAKLEREDDGKMSANIDMPHPRPMKFNAEGTVNSNLVAHSVYLNWDVRDPSSNIKVSTEYKDDSNAYSIDKEMSLKISRAEQTLAIASKLEKSSYKLVSSASVALDDIKASLETELNDRSRGYTKMYHGKVRLNTPYKVLQLEASHSDDLEKITSETTWYWDAERDQSKKIILSSVLQKSASFLKSDLKLQAPSIRKEIRLTSQASLNQGRTIFDGRSELSYSPDSRQTLAITTKIEKTGSEYDDNSNYSVSVGLSHPSTNTDIKVVSHAGQSDNRMSAGAQVIYLNSRRQQKNMELRGEIDRLRKEIHLEVLSPMKSVDIKGKLRTDKSYDLTLHNVYDKSKSIDTSVVIDPEQGNIAISMGSDLNNPSNTVNLRAGYLADNILSVEAYHMSRQGRTTDGLVALTLNTSRILHTRLHWRPSVISEIKRELDRRGRIYQERAESSLAGVLDEIRQELSRRADRVVNDMEGHVTPIVDLLSDASNSLDVEVALLLDKLDKLGMKEALAAAEDAIDSIIKLADQTLEEMSESYDVAKEKITEIYHSAASRLEKYEEILAEASELAREYQVEVENFVKKSLVKIIHEIERLAEASRYHYHKVAEEGRELARASLAKAKDVLDRTLSHPKVKMLKAKLSDLLDKIPELAKPEKIKEISRRVQNMAKSYKVSFANKYIDMIAGAHKTISENVDKLMQRDELRRVHAVANEVYQQGKWAYDYWEVEKNVVEGMRSLVKKIKDMASAEIREHWDSIARLEEWRLVVYNPQDGEIQFEMYLPVALKSLRALPDASIPKIKKTYKKFSNGFKYLKNYNLADTYYSLKPSSDVANWIPPFKAYASVSGKQHFTTFDGRSYEFAGLCSYVLAQDFMDGNFSVILHYDGDWANVQKRSLTVTAGNKRIDIFPDYRVQVDNRPQELPYQYNSVIATRLGNTIRVDTGKGLVVECDLANDLYTVTVSGWFFGKTAGLFGTYDNEPSNDFVMPSRRITEDIGEFAHSWEVGGSCRSNKNFAKTVPLETGKNGFERCSDLYFSSGSPFRPCFRQVSAQNAFSKCMYDHSMESSSTAICGSVALHRMQCGQKGVTLPTPPQCVTCETPNGGMFATGKDLILSPDGIRPPKSADIVFVIEEKECNKKASGELQSVAESVDSALRRQGLTRNLYGIVGYGGFDASNSPLSHTIGGKIMNDARRFGVGADSLSFERKGGVADVMEAVMFASKYPFRTGVSKSIVLMPCSSCETRYVGFEETEQLLKSRGITLHLLKKHDFEFRSNRSPKSTNIFGIDNEGAYSYGGKGQKMAADSNLLTKLRVPSDNCIALAKSTNGKMFNLARLIEGRQRMQRSFRDVWSKSIAQSAEPMSCQECRCVDNSNGVGVSICNQCDKSSYKSATPIGRLESRPRYRTPNQSDDFGSQLKEYLSVRQE